MDFVKRIAAFGLLAASVTGALLAQNNQPCTVNSVAGSVQIFACQGLTKEQGEQFLEILNRMTRDRLDPVAVQSKLDQLPKGGPTLPIELTETQTKNFAKLATMYPGAKVIVQRVKGDEAAKKTAGDLLAILAAANWVQPDGKPLKDAVEFVPERPFTGIEVGTSEVDYKESKMPQPAIPLVLSLQAMGYARQPYLDPAIPQGSVVIRIGARP